MKKKLILLIWMLACGASAFAQSDSLSSDTIDHLNYAESAYKDGRFMEAYAHWEEYVSQSTLVSPDVYYNMGNAAWKMDELGEAIWHWNKALKLDPGMKDAAYNLKFTEKLKVDRITAVDPSALDAFYKRVWSLLSPSNWGVLAVFSFLAMALSLALIKYWKSSISRFFVPLTVVFMIAGLFSAATGWKHQYELDSHLKAVVLQPNVYIKSAPLSGSADAFILHEGTEMDVVQKADDWYEIELADGKVGWVQEDQVGIY